MVTAGDAERGNVTTRGLGTARLDFSSRGDDRSTDATGRVQVRSIFLHCSGQMRIARFVEVFSIFSMGVRMRYADVNVSA